MKLYKLVFELKRLLDEGHGEKEVFYRHNASGDCGELSHPHLTDHTDDSGPFDLEPGQEYISICAGH